MTAAEYIEDLAARGRATFTGGQATRALQVGAVAARAALRRLAGKGAIASPYRGFYVIVSPEYRGLGCLPPEQFIPELMAHLGHPYYVGLLSAAQLHGAAHQQPQELQVLTPRARRTLSCRRVRVAFIARRNLEEIPTQQFRTPQGELRASTPEGTALDLIGYPAHCGGLDNVATVLSELSEQLDGARLVQVASKSSPIPWAQRLGYVLERVGAAAMTPPLAAYIAKVRPCVTPLVPSPSMRGSSRDSRWRIAVNADLQPDL